MNKLFLIFTALLFVVVFLMAFFTISQASPSGYPFICNDDCCSAAVYHPGMGTTLYATHCK